MCKFILNYKPHIFVKNKIEKGHVKVRKRMATRSEKRINAKNKSRDP